MRALAALTLVQAARSLREPPTVIFGLCFAPGLALAMGLIFGNEPAPQFGGRGFVEANLVGFIAIPVVIAGLIIVPTDIVGQRRTGALRRLRATPLRPWAYVLSDVAVRFALLLTSLLLMQAVGYLVFGVRPEGHPGGVVAATALGALAFLATGYLMAAVLPSVGAAQALGNLLAYPLILLSGSAVPTSVLPDDVQRVAQLSPVTHLVRLTQGLSSGDPLSQHLLSLVVLVALLIGSSVLAVRLFRWE